MRSTGGRRARAVRASVVLAASGALVLAACTAPTPEPTPTPTPPPVHQGETRLPEGPSTLLAGAADVDLAVAASGAFFASAPVVVLAEPFTFADEALRPASIAVALGAPLLIVPPPAETAVDDPAADPAAPEDPAAEPPTDPAPPAVDPTSEPTPEPTPDPTAAVAEEVRRLGALAVVTVGTVDAATLDLPADVVVVPAPDGDAALADLLRVTLRARTVTPPDEAAAAAVVGLDRDAPVLLALTGDAPVAPDPSPEPTGDDGDAEPSGDTKPSGDPDAPADPDATPGPDGLPLTELPEAPTGGLLLTTGVPTELAAVATARAAGVDVLAVPSGDPGLTSESVQAIAAAGATSVVGVGPAFAPPEEFAWKVAAAATGVELPGGGQVLFPGRRMIALYGCPTFPELGILGEQDVAASIERVNGLVAAYQPLTTDTVVPAFEIIVTIADRPAGDDGNYSNELDPATFVPWVEAALEAGVYVVLDLQPGRTDFLTQAKLYESLLLYPNVGLALDPEWRLGPNQVHLRQIGSVGVDEVNAVVAYLGELARANALPQKLLVLHQFMQRMIQGRELVDTADPAVQVLIHADGQGSQGGKAGTWANLQTGAPPGVVWGWKNFIDEDNPMATPEQTYQVQPTPHFVSYQ